MEPINRPLLKENAKQVLKRNFWMAMLVCLVGGLLGGNWTGLGRSGGSANFNFGNTFSSSGSSSSYGSGSDLSDFSSTGNGVEAFLEILEDSIQDTEQGEDFYFYYDSSLSEEDNVKAFFHDVLDYFNLTEENVAQGILIFVGVFLLVFVLIWLIATVIQFAISSFVGAPIGVGYRRYFMRNRLGQSSFDDLFSAFSGGHYMDTVKTMFSTNIRIWGWSLLFYFPGLVKFYQYFFVPYIMAENPTISKERAREISSQMSHGHKWQMFVLNLSFLGWAMLFVVEEMFLALISCGLLAIPGMLLIYPLVAYQHATYAELYEERREYMLMSGQAREDELVGF